MNDVYVIDYVFSIFYIPIASDMFLEISFKLLVSDDEMFENWFKIVWDYYKLQYQ